LKHLQFILCLFVVGCVHRNAEPEQPKLELAKIEADLHALDEIICIGKWLSVVEEESQTCKHALQELVVVAQMNPECSATFFGGGQFVLICDDGWLDDAGVPLP
jgi:hypothetical protein